HHYYPSSPTTAPPSAPLGSTSPPSRRVINRFCPSSIFLLATSTRRMREVVSPSPSSPVIRVSSSLYLCISGSPGRRNGRVRARWMSTVMRGVQSRRVRRTGKDRVSAASSRGWVWGFASLSY
ncbi:MAG: hypothetical protein TREMPRED_001515, partial [Tremellales sp. Tagirdzhanova-0007]